MSLKGCSQRNMFVFILEKFLSAVFRQISRSCFISSSPPFSVKTKYEEGKVKELVPTSKQGYKTAHITDDDNPRLFFFEAMR